MYLSVDQHDRFRTLLMGFEIPYQKYIADVILSNYPTIQSFECAMIQKKESLQPSDPLYLRDILPKECTNEKLQKMYTRFLAVKNTSEIVFLDQDIPMVGTLNLVTFSLTSQFQRLYNLFSNYSSFCELSEKYRYARNKLSHPGCRTLEDQHLIPVLSFVKDTCMFLDDKYFVQKTKSQILNEVSYLQQNRMVVPIKKHNLRETPYSDSQIVCRETEIAELKNFIYGNFGDLRKRHSCCVYGYGGVGKTALVIEVLKQIVQDLINGNTNNDYKPEYILFYSAKKRQMSISEETGRVIQQQVRWHIETADELITLILNALELESFKGYHGEGLIVIDNLETLSLDERKKVKQFVETQTPSEMQFILTSRNCEEYEFNIKLSGFEAEAGKKFVKAYIDENALELDLSDTEILELLNISKGNTLVLVLCLKRLSKKLSDISGLQADFSGMNVWKNMRNNLGNIAPNAYEAISEFMFKDTFEQIEIIFSNNVDLFHKILKVFAVVPNSGIDLSTICLLTKCSYPKAEAAVDALCNYLILEKRGSEYFLNQFAEKYIVGRFLPDAESYQKLSAEIVERQNSIRKSLERLKIDMEENPRLANIMRDWQITTGSDRITAAKMYRMYQEVKNECRHGGRFKVEIALEDFIRESKEAEEITAHPYIKYQKARILQLIDKSRILTEQHTEEIRSAFQDAIYVIKTIEQYAAIQYTKSYAALLWLFGQFLVDNGSLLDAIRYLEESKESFERQSIIDEQYFQCITFLGWQYLKYYLNDRSSNIAYLRRARSISHQLKENYSELGSARKYAIQLKNELQKYGVVNI